MAEIGSFMEKETAGLPNWTWLVVIAAGIGATFIVPKLFGNATNTTANTPTTSTDAGTNASGLGLAIDPTTGLPYAVEGLVPSGGTPGTTTPGGGQNNLMQEVGLIRTRNDSPTAVQYDKTHPQGIPIRATASGSSKIIGYEPYGSQVTIAGQEITGTSNFPGSTQGSNIWFPVLTSSGQTGYVSGYDFSGSPAVRPVSWPYQ